MSQEQLSSDSSTDQLLTDELINLPGKVEGSEGQKEPSLDAHLMNRVSPEPSQNGQHKENLYTNEALNNKDMNGDSAPLTTSFSTAADYGMTKKSQGVEGYQNPASRFESVHQTSDVRLESIDFSEQSLYQIARDGDVFLMKAVLDQMQPKRAIRKLNKKDSDKFTPLHYAARYNHYEMCELLLQRGADLHARGEDAVTPLHSVAKYKPKKEKIYGAGDGDKSDISSEEDGVAQGEANIKVLDFLISSGARVNERDYYGMSALHHASLRGNEACVNRLLDCRGILIEAQDKQLMTPLHMCAVYGNVNIAKKLIERGANINCKDGDNGTPLQFAAAEGNLEIVQLIFDKCAKDPQLQICSLLDEKDNDGNTALHLAVDNGHLNVTELIIDQCLANNHSSALNARKANRETPLHVASRHGHIEIVKLLLSKQVKINSRNDSLQTPIFLASQFNHHQVVEYLIECKANIEVHDSDKYSPLLIAANYGHVETVEVLMRHKANINAVDKNDKTVVFMCAEENHVDALQELLKNKKVHSLLEVTDRYDNTPLHAAADNGHFAMVKELLDAGAVIDAKNEDEQTPLHLAAENGSMKIVKELVGRRKDIIHDDDESGNTPLHLAALSGRVHCVRELVRLGANIGARNAKQWTPLDCCASAGMHKSALVLLEADSPVDPKDKRNVTPLHLACQQGHQKMVELLLEWRADVTNRSVLGWNALDFAVEAGKVDCARVIIQSDRWNEALQNRTKHYLSDQLSETPMRKLIRKMPSAAVDVFRNCLRDNGKHPDHPNYQISFNYEFLDDEYTCTNWVDVDDNATEVNVAVEPSNNNEIYDDSGRLFPDAQPYTRNTNTLMNNHPLYVMVKSKRVDLLRHPLVVSLLNHKWRAYGRTFYYVNLFVYVLFLAVLNSYMLTVPPPFAINQTATVVGSCVRVRTEAEPVWGIGCAPLYAEWQPVAAIIIIAMSSFGLLKETYQILSKRTSYIKSLTNLIELALYVLSILLVIDVTDYSRGTGIRENWQWQCGSVAIFLSWMGLLLFIQNFPRFGIYVLMFGDVLRTFISFFAVFVLFILGFAFSFHVLLQNQFAFDRWWNSIIKTFVMMIGEFEYNDIFNSFQTSTDYSSQLMFQTVTYILFVIFVIIMSILIMNLLVGLAVDDIKEVQDNAVLESLAMQVKLALDIEYSLPQFVRRHFMRRYRRYYPNRYRKRNRFIQWLHAEEHLNHHTIKEALNPEKSDLEQMEDKIDNLQSKLRDLRGAVHGLSDRSRQVEDVTQAIANHFNIKWEKNEDDQDSS